MSTPALAIVGVTGAACLTGMVLLMVAGTKQVLAQESLWSTKNIGERIQDECGSNYLEYDTQRHRIFNEMDTRTLRQIEEAFRLFYVARQVVTAAAALSWVLLPWVIHTNKKDKIWFGVLFLALTGIFYGVVEGEFRAKGEMDSLANTFRKNESTVNTEALAARDDDMARTTVLKPINAQQQTLTELRSTIRNKTIFIVVFVAFLFGIQCWEVREDEASRWIFVIAGVALTILAIAVGAMHRCIVVYQGLLNDVRTPYVTHRMNLSRAVQKELGTMQGKPNAKTCEAPSALVRRWVDRLMAVEGALKVGNDPADYLAVRLMRERETGDLKLYRCVEYDGVNQPGVCGTSATAVQRSRMAVEDREAEMIATIDKFGGSYLVWLFVVMALVGYVAMHTMYRNRPGSTAKVVSAAMLVLAVLVVAGAWFVRGAMI